MTAHLRANLCLLVLTVILCCVLYPLVLWGIGKTAFPEQSEGSLIEDAKGQTIGSRLIAQPFTADEYFQPRPSAASYNATASSPSNLAASNYALRDRVARQLGPIAKYAGGQKKGQLVAPDIESWFQQDRYQNEPGIVAQWVKLHTSAAQNWLKGWVTGDKLNAEYMADWEKAHPQDVADWQKDNPDPAEPKPEDLAAGLAVPFFSEWSKQHPGTFPGTVEHKTADGKTEKRIEPVKEGADIQSGFFDMWRDMNPDVSLQDVPADMLTTSGSGLDPHITLSNALWQLDRVAPAWAKKTSGDEATIRREIKQLLHQKSVAPLGGLVGVDLVNVLEINLALQEQYQKTAGK
ncbi:MAG: potassium-transporting ATPase subunit C [Thermoguttaceae bacterium]